MLQKDEQQRELGKECYFLPKGEQTVTDVLSAGTMGIALPDWQLVKQVSKGKDRRECFLLDM